MFLFMKSLSYLGIYLSTEFINPTFYLYLDDICRELRLGDRQLGSGSTQVSPKSSTKPLIPTLYDDTSESFQAR